MCVAWCGTVLERTACNLGPLALLAPLLEQMDVAAIIDRHVPPDPQLEYPHGQVLRLLLAARLCQPLALVILYGLPRQLPQEFHHGLLLAGRKERGHQVEGDRIAGFRPPGILRAGPSGHEIPGLLEQMLADLHAVITVLRQHMDDGRSHGIARVRILLDLFEEPGPPRLGLELETEMVQLLRIDEQVGMLRRRLKCAGTLEGEQDAETAKGRSQVVGQWHDRRDVGGEFREIAAHRIPLFCPLWLFLEPGL